MAPSFDCLVVSSLFCDENDSVFDENDNCEPTTIHRNYDQNHSFNRGDVLSIKSDEVLSSLILKESEHLPNSDYLKRLRNGDLDLFSRTLAVDWICEVNARFGFGPLCAYLAINYLDRFLSSYELPKGKAWMMQLLAVACLSLAAKVEETEVPLSPDLQVGESSKFVFEPRTIQRMELLVLTTLKWRLQSVTPFSFLEYFHSKINSDQTLQRLPILKSIQLISSIVKGIDLLEFKPSEIAAAVVVISSGEETLTVLDCEKAVSALSQFVEKGRLLKCTQLIQDLALTGGIGTRFGMIGSSSLRPAPPSPNGVLEAACLSSNSEDSAMGSCLLSSSPPHKNNVSPVAKRRKLNINRDVEKPEN